MSQFEALPFDAPLEAYDRQAERLLAAYMAGDGGAVEAFKWLDPRFRDRPLSAVPGAALNLDDARSVVARHHAFESWEDLQAFTLAVRSEGHPVARFERAVDAVVSGDAPLLRNMLDEHGDLVRARSTRRHHATLLHYVAANGVEGMRQETPANAVEIAELLLAAGAEPDALADMYDEKCTTMSMLVSSSHPARAGLQVALAETLLDHGAGYAGPGSRWESAVLTALTFGFPDTAEALVRRGAPVETLAAAAGLGRIEDVSRLLPFADGLERHRAFALAAQLGRTQAVRLLLDVGESPDRYNPEGFHAHATPLHQAISAGHLDVVRLLVERGARLDIRDTIFEGTPLGWAEYLDRKEIVEYLRRVDAPA